MNDLESEFFNSFVSFLEASSYPLYSYVKKNGIQAIENLIPVYEYNPPEVPGGYRLDFAFPDLKVGIELDGGRGGGYGRAVRCHACGATVRARLKSGGLGKPLRIPYPSHSGKQQERDLLKQNLLVEKGWIILRYSSTMLKEDPEGIFNQIIKVTVTRRWT